MSDNDRLPLLPYSKQKIHGKEVTKPKTIGQERKAKGADELERQPITFFIFQTVFFIAKYFKMEKHKFSKYNLKCLQKPKTKQDEKLCICKENVNVGSWNMQSDAQRDSRKQLNEILKS